MLETEAPHLQRQTRRLVTIFAATGSAVSLIVVTLYGYLRGDWLQGILAGIADGMAMPPEEFPMVFAVFMAMGASRISKARVLTRRALAIEFLGAASALCTNTTGTLTENRMAVAELRLPDGQALTVGQGSLTGRFLTLATSGTAASNPNPFDSMEKAFPSLAPLSDAGVLLRTYPIAPELQTTAPASVWSIRHS
jgi:P-type Ca2+ transporter type 2C